MGKIELLQAAYNQVKQAQLISKDHHIKTRQILRDGNWALLTQSPKSVRVSITDGEVEHISEIAVIDEEVVPLKKGKPVKWDAYSYAALSLCLEHASWMNENLNGKQYTREGMIHRVMDERREKAFNSEYRIKLADNLYGEHQLTNERGHTFHITLWNFEKETGYIDNIDWRTNKLGTTKHIIYLFDYIKRNKRKTNKLDKHYPFVDITLDPFHEYKITWVYPNKLDNRTARIIQTYFGKKSHLEDDDIPTFLPLLREVQDYNHFKIRPEVLEKVDDYFNRRAVKTIFDKAKVNYVGINAVLFPYQKEGVEFVLPKQGAIIADEMGLGKTIQAITIAILKKQLYGFEKTLVICPASLKYQWKSEIEKFSNEKAVVVEGFPKNRVDIYKREEPFFFIVNYEMVLRDLGVINEEGFDFVILDEAQKIKNFTTKTAVAIKRVKKQHGLVITGTPIENKLADLYSIIQFVEPYMLTPLWEFSYQHCLFDVSSKNRIIGYYNLSNLKKRLDNLIIRREKRLVIDQLPHLNQKNIYIPLHEEQANLHASFLGGVAKILSKRFKTQYDWQRLILLLTNMRMACDSTYLIDKKTNHSTKLIELRHILCDRLDLKNNERKIIIFSEWIHMLRLIGEMLHEIGFGFVMLTGKVPVKKRKDLIREFEQNDACRIFLSTESGGSGLNLQMADIVINYELPWNPAKKNQRIGRIDRLGQKSEVLSVFNLVTIGSIEEKIATGLLLKQNLFDGVLSMQTNIDSVDFSEKGRAQFIQQLEEVVHDLENPISEFEEEEMEGEDPLEEMISVDDEEEILAEERLSDDRPDVDKFEHLETVLNKGMEFLSGIYKMASGEDLQADEGKSIKVDRETGEVTMKFKIKF